MKENEFRILPILAILAALGAAGLGGAALSAAEDTSERGKGVAPLDVFVSIPPVTYLVERVGGERVRVRALAEKGQDPHTFDPSPRQVAALAKAEIYFTTHLPFEESLLPRIQRMNPVLIVSDAAEGIRRRLLTEPHNHETGTEGHPEHKDHGHDLRHEAKETRAAADAHENHPEPDPHVWLGPDNAKRMAENICRSLEKIRPEDKELFRKNLETLKADLDAVSERIGKILRTHRFKRFYVYHPAFGYFGDQFHLEQVPLEIEGKSPTPKQIQDFIRQARADGAKIIFAQPQFDKKSAETIARAIGGAVVPMDPLAKDLLKNFQDMAEKLEKAFKKNDRPYPSDRTDRSDLSHPSDLPDG